MTSEANEEYKEKLVYVSFSCNTIAGPLYQVDFYSSRRYMWKDEIKKLPSKGYILQ